MKYMDKEIKKINLFIGKFPASENDKLLLIPDGTSRSMGIKMVKDIIPEEKGELTIKYCNKCARDLPIDMFSKRSDCNYLAYKSECKECSANRRKVHYEQQKRLEEEQMRKDYYIRHFNHFGW